MNLLMQSPVENTCLPALKHQVDSNPVDPLGLIHYLMGQLNHHKISYHFCKGSKHLSEDINGEKDLSLLISLDQQALFENLIIQLGFKRCISSDLQYIPEIEDFTGFDRLTGKLIHLHVHYLLNFQDLLTHNFNAIHYRDSLVFPASGGITLAIVGADGAGKSSIIAEIVTWLSSQYKVFHFYMGSQQPSWHTRLFKGIYRLFGLGYAGCRRILGPDNLLTSIAGKIYRLAKGVTYLSEGIDRYKRFKEGKKYSDQGAIVIYDRYPLTAFGESADILDGPRIAEFFGGQMGPLEAWLSNTEKNLYEKILHPQWVFVLLVNPEISLLRKPDHKLEEVRRKDEVFRKLDFDHLNYIQVNADNPLEEVIMTIKDVVWRFV